jgi:hypothetical protein
MDISHDGAVEKCLSPTHGLFELPGRKELRSVQIIGNFDADTQMLDSVR